MPRYWCDVELQLPGGSFVSAADFSLEGVEIKAADEEGADLKVHGRLERMWGKELYRALANYAFVDLTEVAA